MAKIKQNNFLDTVNEVFMDAIREGVLHLYADGSDFTGRTIGIGSKKLFHFGTTGYLGLEQDNRLKQAAMEAISRYGTQFPLSKSYISNPLYGQLEEKLKAMYQNPVFITKNSTLGHLGIIPSAVKDQDAIILDHQVHWSVQNAAKMLKARSVPIDMIRHNDLDALETKIKALSGTRKRIWYMADGIYSMYGDTAPVEALKALGSKYPQLYLYFDDVHGMSWIGKHGTGYVLDALQELPDNVLLVGTLSKTFGASGAVLVCSDKTMHRELKTFGGPLTFSAQLEPASLAAASASADIHLSPEIYKLQEDLRDRIGYFNVLLEETDLPLVKKNNSPVFYIGTGMPRTGYDFVKRLMKEGFYVNLGLFPAVPVKNTGVRITISRHNQKQEMKALVEAMTFHFPKALEATHTNAVRVFQAFKLDPKMAEQANSNSGLEVQIETSVSKIDQTLWDRSVGMHGTYDWEGLRFLERAFSGNRLDEHHWRFWYIIISDAKQHPILATFFTSGLWKDDMLASAEISKAMEEKRKTNPYYLTSKVLGMGSLFTEGQHLYLDKSHPQWQGAMDELVRITERLERECGAKMIVLRDFSEQTDLHAYFQGQGFVRVRMPDAAKILFGKDQTLEGFMSQLSRRNRRHLRKEILELEPLLEVKVLKTCNRAQLDRIRELYAQVHRNNLGLNTFPFPQRLFEAMAADPGWEFICINVPKRPERMIGVMLCYTNASKTYVPAFVGLDYDYLKQYNTYRQLLYQTIKRALALKLPCVDMGMTASFEKRKLGAVVSKRYAYIQTADNYTLELMGILEGR